jgi:uncharacterized protein YciW
MLQKMLACASQRNGKPPTHISPSLKNSHRPSEKRSSGLRLLKRDANSACSRLRKLTVKARRRKSSPRHDERRLMATMSDGGVSDMDMTAVATIPTRMPASALATIATLAAKPRIAKRNSSAALSAVGLFMGSLLLITRIGNTCLLLPSV